ncbi:hypothetical protein SAMN00808754_0280 [Thermanaeromonas toyohensis ToBE]|uniref:Uncharacterized protein n=1 Tax=Thermanaeromonas toyohensis ToBE TaxID=698762 RepID=A0A1W1VAG0_9FIRM|nr:hypothetical protein [Thermanaeromonas toyohensis]SMB90342.1 hypothetical protein SAMN00808754_0280 [Thermanaeromonas toyohensis ToBE]
MPFVICDCPCTFGRDGQCELDKVLLTGGPALCPYKNKKQHRSQDFSRVEKRDSII